MLYNHLLLWNTSLYSFKLKKYIFFPSASATFRKNPAQIHWNQNYSAFPHALTVLMSPVYKSTHKSVQGRQPDMLGHLQPLQWGELGIISCPFHFRG